MPDVLSFILARYNYWIVIVLMMTGLYIVFSRGNLVKTVVGLNIFQTSVFIFYITISKVAGGTAPILIGGHGGEDSHDGEYAVTHDDEHVATGQEGDLLHGADYTEVVPMGMPHDAVIGDPTGVEVLRIAGSAAGEIAYSNPLPHVLILTAIVVGVATTAVGLAIAVRIREAYGTVEEDALEAMDNAASVAERLSAPVTSERS